MWVTSPIELVALQNEKEISPPYKVTVRRRPPTNQEKSPHQEPDHNDPLTLDFPASRVVGSQCLPWKPPSPHYFAVAAGDTWDNLFVPQ